MAKYTKSVIKALDVMEVLASNEGRMNLSELSSKLNYSQSTAFRILHTLERRGYLTKTNGQYGIGPAVLQLKLNAQNDVRSDLADLSRPYLVNLEEKTHSTSCLAIREGTKATPVQIIPGSAKLVVNSNLNEKIPLHATSLGKSILAFLTEQKREKLINQLKLTRQTENTIVEPETLEDELMEVRKNGYAVDREEYSEGVFCVGAPVMGEYSDENSPVASVSIATPNFQDSPKTISELSNYVVNTARQISKVSGPKNK